MSRSRALWLRWSLRDLRQRWLSVVAIALIISIGTGVFVGLNSTAEWRRLSNDASFAALAFHDLRVQLGQDTTVDEGTLRAAVRDVPSFEQVAAAQERLVVATQLDASTEDDVVLVPGRLVGTDTTAGSAVDRLDVPIGRRPTPGAAVTEVVLEQKFAAAVDLPAQGDAVLAGGRPVRYTGHGMQPDDFYVTGPAGALLVEAGFAVVYTELADAQQLSGNPGQVNELVLLLTDGADVAAVQAELEVLVDRLPGVSATIVAQADEPAFRVLYDDIDNDQKVWNVLSLLVLGAAALAAFNLIGRVVDTQRREIGVQMALGVPPRRIARRPLLTAAQIALLGAVLGVGVGLAVGAAMRNLLVTFLPLPIWRTPFQVLTYVQGAALGFLVPFVGSILPVRRAVRVTPVEAIRTSHVAVRGRWTGRLLARLRLPGGSLAQLPLRNLVRAPRRTLLTALGVGAAIAVLVGVLGMLDSLRATISIGKAEVLQDVPDRVVVQLNGFALVDSPEVQDIISSPLVGAAGPRLQVGATVHPADGPEAEAIELLVSVLDLDGEPWAPTVLDRVDPTARAPGVPGIVLARKAADDLGVRPGEDVVLRHLAVVDGGFETVETTVVVAGLHPSPLRPLAFVDVDDVATFGLAGVVNALDLIPADGVETEQLQRFLFETPTVASAEPARAITDLFEDALGQIVGVLVILSVAILLLAALIAFNSTSISTDERAREHATMFAFGLPIRAVTGLMVRENVAVGVASTLVGVGLGYLLARWMVTSLIADTVPEFGFVVDLRAATVGIALVIGVVAVGLTPVLVVRRLTRMDVPDALRVME